MAWVPSWYWRTLTRALTKWARRGLAGICSFNRLNDTQLSLPTRRSSCTQRISARLIPAIATKALPSCSGFTAKRALWADIDITKKHVGRFHRRDPGQCQFLRQPILQRVEDTLGTTSRLRRIGRDMLDTEMLQCPTDLRRARPVDLSAGGRRGKIMAAPIGVEAQRQAMSAKHFLKPTKRRGRAFFRHQQGRIDRARRVIHGHDEIERRPTAQPFVP